MKRYMVFEVGCIECGVSSTIAGFFDTEKEAIIAASKMEKKLHGRAGGDSNFEVFDLEAELDPIFAGALL